MMEFLKNIFGFDVEVKEVKPWWDGGGIVLEVGVDGATFARIRSWIIERISPVDYEEEVNGIWWGNFYFYVVD